MKLKRWFVILVLLLPTLAACGQQASTSPTSEAVAPTTAAQAAPTSAAAPTTVATEAPAAATAAPTEAASGAAPTEGATAAGAAPTEAATTAAAAATTGPVADLQVDKSKLSKELHFYNWSDYIDPTVLEDFEKEYGVKVTMEVYGNNEDMIAKVRPGNSGYDVVVPSDYAVDIMAKEKLLAPLDKSLLPNFARMKKANLDLYYDKGNMYSIPYNEGMTGIAYNKSKLPTPPDSWGVLLDPKQAEQYKGQFTMLDDEREVPGAALHYIGKSMNDTDSADLTKIEGILKEQKPFVSAYDSDTVARKLASGEIVAAQAYTTAAAQARLGLSGGDDAFSGNNDIEFVVPKEGGTIWQDNLAILASSQNQYTAHVFLNFMMRPDVSAKNAAYNFGITPNADSDSLLDPKLQELYTEGFAPNADMLKRLEWIERNDKTSAFTDLWTAVKGE